MTISLITEVHLVFRLFSFAARLFTVCVEFLNTTTITFAATQNVDGWMCDQ